MRKVRSKIERLTDAKYSFCIDNWLIDVYVRHHKTDKEAYILTFIPPFPMDPFIKEIKHGGRYQLIKKVKEFIMFYVYSDSKQFLTD